MMNRQFSFLIATLVMSLVAGTSFAQSSNISSGAGSSANLSDHDSTSSPEATPSVGSSKPSEEMSTTGSTRLGGSTSSPPSTNPTGKMVPPNPSPGSVNMPSGVPGADAP